MPHGPGWALGDDLQVLRDPADPEPARPVPPYDPVLGTRDRTSLVPERAHQKAIWRAVANPGVVVARNRIVGTCRGRARGSRFDITVEPFTTGAVDLDHLHADGRAIAVARGRSSVHLALA